METKLPAKYTSSSFWPVHSQVFFSSPPLCKADSIKPTSYNSHVFVPYSQPIATQRYWCSVNGQTLHLHHNDAVTKHTKLIYHLHNRGYIYSFNVTLSINGLFVNTAPSSYCERTFVDLAVLCGCATDRCSYPHHANHYIFLSQKHFY